MNNVEISYTTSPISEYIGSKIYESLDIEVHETKLGIADEITEEKLTKLSKIANNIDKR